VLVLLGHCSCCGAAVPGLESLKYPGMVRLDYHINSRRPHLFICIGSRSSTEPEAAWRRLSGAARTPAGL
jgi:hypothetical protein